VSFGVSKAVAEAVKEHYTLLRDDEILKEYKSFFAQFLTEYITKKKPWEW
jgi:hypothetical protein